MSVEARRDNYQTTLEDGTLAEYEIRGLNEDEISGWAQFCASIFSYKANPPPHSYFEGHYHNDPERFPQLIRVAISGNTIVASCRLFLRTLSGNVPAGGIGEVCTAPEHRRRGLSKVLLQNVLDIMKERKLSVSLLHAAPVFFPVYEAVGYTRSTSQWSILTISQEQLEEFTVNAEKTSGTSSLRIRDASFPMDTDQLCSIHQRFSEDRFAGCIVRSTNYWNNYLRVELQGSLLVLEQSHVIIAWLSLRLRGDRVQVREFGFDETSSSSGGVPVGVAFSMLLAQAIKSVNIVSDEWKLILPTFLLETCHKDNLPFVAWESVCREDDLGWMYKILDNRITLQSINGSTRPHLIWPADSF
jgi:GNAT superfamily N-acetyltransferase